MTLIGGFALAFWGLTWLAYSWARSQNDNFGAIVLVLMCGSVALVGSVAWVILRVMA